MKAKSLFLISAAALGLTILPTSFAEPLDSQDGGGRRWKQERRLANLSPEERTKLRSAHRTAMADPAVQAAKDRLRQAARDFRDLKRQTMLRADPTIQPILDKVPQRGNRDS